MKKKNETDALNELIILQQHQYDVELQLLKEQFRIAYESVKPVNLIKNLVHDVTSSPEIKEDIMGNIMGLATGFFSKKMMVDKDSSTIKKLFGTVLQFVIGNVVSNHSIDIKAIGTALFNNIFNKK